jgi:hypothetical protein
VGGSVSYWTTGVGFPVKEGIFLFTTESILASGRTQDTLLPGGSLSGDKAAEEWI